ncbi:rod shape-determining protein MreC [Hephaestia sp. GCM10023244]|uniref:rod shape-determining protein MreC n=1 Tax=unclassified Hephaestia TaxID=2631281 RepID=UPI0020778A5B|nr:rod shape-determining protein MreC [Hephaestia sp. MAHUQ-44]MCM8731314.1 rod shape-determining protein MreC [Hephaestia sp. MAHUQ-44]
MAPPKNRRPGFSRRAQYGLFLGYVIAAAGALVGAILLVISAIDPSGFASLRMAAAEATAPVSTALSSVTRGVTSIPRAIGDHFGTVDENRRLKQQIADERVLLTRARTLAYDNRRLKALLAVRERSSDTVAVARIVSSSGSSTRRFGLLNAGRRQGVREGQPVRGPEGLIGRVLEVGPDVARILLITDPDSVVPVRRTRDGLPAMATGRGDGLVEVRPVSMGDPLPKPGDVLMSSGIGGIYPPDIPVARVLQVGRDAAIARPFARPGTLDVAMVQRAFFPLPPPLPPSHNAPPAPTTIVTPDPAP